MMGVKDALWFPVYVLDWLLSRPVIYMTAPEHRKSLLNYDMILRHEVVAERLTQLQGVTATPRVTVLDVGGGGDAIARYLTPMSSWWCVSLDRDVMQIRRVLQRGETSSAVCGSGSALPFPEGSFDFVVCIHALEHIPDRKKDIVIDELKRVARHFVIIEGPCGKHSERLSRVFVRALRGAGVKVPAAALEHLEAGVPKRTWLRKVFAGATITHRRNFHVELLVLFLAHLPLLRWTSGPLYRLFLRQKDEHAPFVESLVIWKKEQRAVGTSQA
jgi:SAM-dependent methyltransferase